MKKGRRKEEDEEALKAPERLECRENREKRVKGGPACDESVRKEEAETCDDYIDRKCRSGKVQDTSFTSLTCCFEAREDRKEKEEMRCPPAMPPFTSPPVTLHPAMSF